MKSGLSVLRVFFMQPVLAYDLVVRRTDIMVELLFHRTAG